jgi:hypothetical protein
MEKVPDPFGEGVFKGVCELYIISTAINSERLINTFL